VTGAVQIQKESLNSAGNAPSGNAPIQKDMQPAPTVLSSPVLFLKKTLNGPPKAKRLWKDEEIRHNPTFKTLLLKFHQITRLI